MFNKPPDHIRYSRQTGFTGITPNDKEQWKRRYPYIEDYELTVQEAEGWLTKHWNKVRMAEQRPRDFLDHWLGCKWLNLNTEGYKEPETIYNPEQLISFIEQYFNSAELLNIMSRGKSESYLDTLTKEHYEKALGHAVKLRKEISDFPQTPEASGKSSIDLRRLQEWCIDCQRISNDFITRIKLDRLEKGLSILRELRELLKSGFPPIDQDKWSRFKEKVRSDLDKIATVVEELSESLTTPAKDSKMMFKYNFQHWYHRVIFGQDCEPLLKKFAEYKIHVPNNMEELAEVITAAEWMKKIDWDKVQAIVEERESGKALMFRGVN
jgi:hypothetical protein